MRGHTDFNDIRKSVHGSLACEMLYTISEVFAEKSRCNAIMHEHCLGLLLLSDMKFKVHFHIHRHMSVSIKSPKNANKP